MFEMVNSRTGVTLGLVIMGSAVVVADRSQLRPPIEFSLLSGQLSGTAWRVWPLTGRDKLRQIEPLDSPFTGTRIEILVDKHQQ